jgi:prevent-host-death family protein
MITVNIHEAKTRLSSLLAALEETGEVIRICRNGKPVAEIRPLEPKKNPLRLHPQLRKVEFHEDPVAPLRPDDWPDTEL